MKKIMLGTSLIVLLLAGCGEPPKKLGTFVEVKVKDTKVIEHCRRGCWYEYKITLEKGGTVVNLNAKSEEMANLLQKGNIVNITYNEDYYITKVTFPMMEK